MAGPEPLRAGAAEPDPESVARTIALRQLAAAARSRRELAQALARRGVPDHVARRVLDRFEEVGLLDDVSYAEAFVRSRHEERHLGRRAIASKLRDKGIDPDVAEAALAAVDDDSERAAATALAARRAESMRRSGLDRETLSRRLLGLLRRRGFSLTVSLTAVEEVLSASGPESTDL